MRSHRRWLELVLVIVTVSVLAVMLNLTPKNGEPTDASSAAPTASPSPHQTADPVDMASPMPSDSGVKGLVALDGKMPPTINEKHQILVETDAGNFTLELYPQAAPNAVKQFLELVEVGFYNNTPISRVVDNFVTQFGINHQMKEWKDKNFDDDPSLFQMLPGTIAFAKAGANTNSTQVFINLAQNNRLTDPPMNFTVFGQVIDGMPTVRELKSGGDPDMGLDQDSLWDDAKYLDGLAEKPNLILKMTKIDQ